MRSHMPWYRIDPQAITDATVVMDGPTAHHLIRVLRVQRGDALTCTDGAGSRWDGVVAAIDRSSLTLTLGERSTIPPPPSTITLACALLPQDRWRFVLEKSVEMGALIIQPLTTERTVAHAVKDSKVEKWQAIANGAAEQCCTAWAPTVCSPMPFEAMVEQRSDFDASYLCHPDSAPSFLRRQEAHASALILIGPEGGFTNTEVTLAEEHGAQRLDLGPRILRAETAVVAALTTLTL